MALSGIVHRLNQHGLGSVKSENKIYHIPYVIEGEEVEFIEKFSCNKFSRGSLTKIITPSNNRENPPCPHFTSCGGCNLQHLKTKTYQEFKKSLVADLLIYSQSTIKVNNYSDEEENKLDLGKQSNINFHFLEAGDRRRATFHLKKENDHTKIGFYEFESQNIIEIKNCQLLSKRLFSFFLEAKEIILKNISLIKDKNVDFSITELDNGCEIVFIFKRPHLKDFQLLANQFQQKNFARIIFKNDNKIILNKEFFPPQISMNGFTFPYPKSAFLQATQKAEEILSNLAIKFASNKNKIIDLYSGMGPYSLAVANKTSAKIDSYEGSHDMVESLQNLSRKENLPIQAFCRDLHHNPVKNWQDIDGVIINPPRNGAEKQIIEIAKNKVPEILMISCSLNELKRDINILLNQGYEIVEIDVIDQFPWSAHLESCTKLVLKI